MSVDLSCQKIKSPVDDPGSGLFFNLLVVSKGVGGGFLKIYLLSFTFYQVCRSRVDNTLAAPEPVLKGHL